MKRGRWGVFVVALVLVGAALTLATAQPSGALEPLADSGWSWQNPLPDGNPLEDVAFVDTQTGWAVGGYGTILATTDGGETWWRQVGHTTARLWGCQFLDAQHGWAVGDEGLVLATTDGGHTWIVRHSGDDLSIRECCFVDEQHGWAATMEGVYITSDGGRSWELQDPGYAGNFTSIFFLDDVRGWAVGSLGILRTTDGGLHWSDPNDTTLPADISEDFQDCWFTDAEHGVVVGSGSTVITTSDGGATWQARAISPAAHLGGVCFADADNGWTVGSGGMVFATSDGGADWSLQRTGAVDYHGGLMLNGCSFVDGQCGWALGDGGVIVRTTDGGATWTSCGAAWLDQRTSGSNAYLWDCDFVDGLHGMAVGDGQTLMMTSDGGRAWAPVLPDTPVDQADLYDCDWADGDTLWAVGCSWNADVSAWDGLVWRSTDAGATWDRSTTGSDGPLGACSFPDSTHGWTADADGVLDVTTDGGQTWLHQALTTSDVQLCSVDFVSDSRGWCTTVDGRLWATTNGGKDWDVQYRRPEGMQGCEFIDARHGWLAADGIFATADGGHSWKRQSTLRPGSLRFLDADRGIAIGDSQTVGVVVTTDGGTTWQKASPPTDAQLLGCAFPTASRAYLVGVDGAILALDRQAPTSTVTSAPAWTNHSVAVALQARDAGAGLSVVCRRIDEASAYANPSATLPITLGAPGDHSGDGLHTLEGWAIDRAGNRSPRVARTVGVDTRRPRTLAPSASRVTRGGVASLAFRVVDAAPNGGTAKVRILVKDRNGIVVRRVFATVKVNVLRTAHFVCHLAKGSYTFTVLATDRAGNHQAASGHSRLVVR